MKRTQPMAVGMLLLLASACATTKKPAQADPAAPAAPATEASQAAVAAPAESGGTIRNGVSRQAYYHPASQSHIEAMEQALKALESIPVERKVADGR